MSLSTEEIKRKAKALNTLKKMLDKKNIAEYYAIMFDETVSYDRFGSRVGTPLSPNPHQTSDSATNNLDASRPKRLRG